jgi:hypothetical protein
VSNCLIGFTNRVAAATLSGGSWLAGLPLTNVQSEIIGVKARSTNAALASTKFLIDLGSANLPTVICALVAHNISTEGKIRMRASETDPTMVANVVYDSGWGDTWPPVYQTEDVPWEADNCWEGQWTPEQRSGLNFPAWRATSYPIYARYWLIEIDDTVNTAGYIEIGRVFLGNAWQPTINMAYGAGIGIEDPSEIDEAISGAEFASKRAKYRVAHFTIENLTTDEAMSYGFDLMRAVGTTDDVLFIYDPTETLHSQRRSMLGRLRTLSAIETVNVDANTTVWEVKEKL